MNKTVTYLVDTMAFCECTEILMRRKLKMWIRSIFSHEFIVMLRRAMIKFLLICMCVELIIMY